MRIAVLASSLCLAFGPALAGCSSDGGSPPPGGGAPGTDGRAQGSPDGGGAGDGAGAADAADGGGDPLDPHLAPPVDMDPSHYPSNVWVTTAMEKVRATDAPPASPAPTRWALLSAARNETESFQVHVHASAALAGVTVTASDLHDARSGASIAGVAVSRELYLDIPQALRSDVNGTSGLVPDALVPAKDTYLGEARNAFPVDVAAGHNASAWIDVHVPAGTPSGWYTGTVTVAAGGATLATLPVRLGVWNVDLPSTASLRSDFGLSWNGACVQAYGGYNGCGAATGGSADDGVEYFHVLFATFALDHRVSLGDVVYTGGDTSDWTHFDALYGPLLDGTAKTQLAGAKLTAMNYQGASNDTAKLGRWATHFRAKGWLDRLDYYHCDEPASGNSCSFAQALSEENATHAVAGDFSTLLTADIQDITSHGLLDAVDILTPVLDQMQPHGMASARPMYDAFLARSPQKRLFWYQSCDEHESCTNGSPGPASATWASYMVDATPMRNRVFQWLAFLFRVQGELYYASDLCLAEACGPSGAQSTNPLVSLYFAGGHGDGTLFYAGTPAVIGGTHTVPMSSVRFELIREGMEDFELLHMLDAHGDGAFATTQAQSFIRRADDFDGDPAKLYAARQALGDRLHARSLGH